MTIDAVAVRALADEFDKYLVGGRVQALVEIDDLSIGFEIYNQHQRHNLFITADARTARCHLAPEKLRRGVETPSPLGLLLRKYVNGAHLNAVKQPYWERVLFFDFSSSEGETRLIVELMGKHSNIILTAGDEIIETLKRIGPDKNRYRVVLPGKPYVPPPPQNKSFPEQVTPGSMETYLNSDPDKPAWRALVNNIAGISPLLAREIIHRASGDSEAPAFDVDPDLVCEFFSTLIDQVHDHHWFPSIVPIESGEGHQAFAAYKLTQFEGWQPTESISAAISSYFGALGLLDAYAPARETVQSQLDSALDRARRKVASLERESTSPEEIEDLRKKGELLLAYGPTLKPGQEILKAQYDPDAPPLEIMLDTDLSAVENAQQYFERYDKAKRAYQDVPRLQRKARHDLAYLEQLATDLSLAENWPEIDAVRDALENSGLWQGQRTKRPGGGKPGIRRFTTAEGFVVFVGRNAIQNHELVTQRSGRSDLWLHARRIPGSHVIIRNDGRPIPDTVIEYAAQLAAYYSAKREDTSVEVDVTERRYVRPIKGGKPGMVNYKNEYTLTVKPLQPE